VITPPGGGPSHPAQAKTISSALSSRPPALILNHPHLEHSLGRLRPGAPAVHVDQQLGGAVRVLGVHAAQMGDDQRSAR
jgi:hypothetical protein